MTYKEKGAILVRWLAGRRRRQEDIFKLSASLSACISKTIKCSGKTRGIAAASGIAVTLSQPLSFGQQHSNLGRAFTQDKVPAADGHVDRLLHGDDIESCSS
jgi:hypothetical protein